MKYMLKSQSANDQIFKQLVIDHGDKIYNLALLRSNNLDMAQDICQETFIRAYKGLPNFRDDSQIGTWLYRIALNVCHTTLAKERHRSRLSVDLNDKDIELADEDGSIEDEFFDRVRNEQLREAIKRLPQHQADAITLYYLKEFQYAEVAKIMDLPLNTVKSHLRRGKANLKTLLTEMRIV